MRMVCLWLTCLISITWALGIRTSTSRTSIKEKRSETNEFDELLKRINRWSGNRCLYNCIRRQKNPREQCYNECGSQFGTALDPIHEQQAMSDICFASCLKGREKLNVDEREMCSRACEGEWMIKPNEADPYGSAFQLQATGRADSSSRSLAGAVQHFLAGGRDMSTGMLQRVAKAIDVALMKTTPSVAPSGRTAVDGSRLFRSPGMRALAS